MNELNMDPVKIGKALRAARGNEAAAEVCKIVGIAESALRMYESGHRIPRDDIKIRLADHYNKSITELFYFT